MRKNIDIDLYKDGFNVKKLNCIQNPLAAAAGCFERENYFYYSFLYSFFSFFEGIDDDFEDFPKRFLPVLGLKFNTFEYSDEESLFSYIESEIENNAPVFLSVKYNCLFYNIYYKNNNFNLIHGLLVSGFDDEKLFFTVNDSSLLRNLFIHEENSDIYFPLQIKYSDLSDIVMSSNETYLNDNYLYSNFYNKAFSISKNNDIDVVMTPKKILVAALEKIDTSESVVIRDIRKYAPDNSFAIFRNNYEDYMRNFNAALIPIFRLLYMCINDDNEYKMKIEGVEERIRESKQNVLSRFIKKAITKRPLLDDEKNDMINRWRDGDKEVIELIKEISAFSSENKLIYTYLDILPYYNCQAFESELRDDSIADITGEGTHFLYKNVVSDTVWKKNDFEFWYQYQKNKNDHISCGGQLIELKNEVCASRISILGCSEYGSYQEKITINYSDGQLEEITADFSDFYQPSIYDETLFWSSAALDRKNGKTTYHNFSSRIFAKRYNIRKGNVSSIKLPDKRNIHIFAITLES